MGRPKLDNAVQVSWMETQPGKKRFQHALLSWYIVNRRALPWRETGDPYRIWISEIMLQQTRVATVIPHYHRFLRRFATLQKLAAARETSVLAAWSGLGYYRRAKMMHAAAKTIATKYGGRFPSDRELLLDLPGIGRYTSAAIASIAYGLPAAVVDGNVGRVLARFLGKDVSEARLWQVAEQLLDRERPGDFNQALMELGATICIPKEPKCLHCPVKTYCASHGSVTTKPARSAKIKRKISFTLDRRNGTVFLVKREAKATLMPGMWGLPMSAQRTEVSRRIFKMRHSITTTDFDVSVIEGLVSTSEVGCWVRERRLTTLPLTGLARKILCAAGIIQRNGSAK